MKVKPDNSDVTRPEWYAARERAPHLDQPNHRPRIDAAVAMIRSLLEPGMSVSDFGAGDGGLLSLLDCPRWGYDLMPSNLGHRGQDVRLVDFVNDPVEYGDISVATEVLEHLDDPAGFLRRVKSRWMVLSTPADETPEHHDSLHVWCWDEQEFADVVRSAGWAIRKQDRVGRFQVVLAERVDMVTLVPSRGRPQNIERLLKCYAATGAVSDLIVLVDDDDPAVDAYKALSCRVEVGPRRRIGPSMNEWAPKMPHAVIGFMGDDHAPRTPGWDVKIFEASTPFAVVYGDDLLQRERLATACWQGAGIIRALGQFCPPECWHLYLDNYWMDLGRALGTLTYLPDVVIEHMHPHAQKAAKDDQYKEVNSASFYEHDRAAWEKYREEQFYVDIAKVKL